MYINVAILKESGVPIHWVPYLQIVQQNRDEDLSEFIQENITDAVLGKLEEEGFTTYIKGSKNQSIYEKVRLTKKGKDFLKNLDTIMAIGEDIAVFDYMAEIYRSSGKEIGNAKKTKTFIAEFRVRTGINRNRLVSLLTAFTEDENNFHYSQRLEYLFFKGANAFDTRFDPEQSRLYQYYLAKEDYFKSLWESPEFNR